MLIKTKRGWELPESAATSESHFLKRRSLIKGLAAGPILAAGAGLLSACDEVGEAAAETAEGDPDPSAPLYPVARNPRYTVERPITEEELATTYNNYYEFGSSKNIWQRAQSLPIRPWSVEISGLVENPQTLGFDELLAKMPLEERVYRHRCVEAWAMTVPWSGFPLAALVKLAAPKPEAKYVRMTSFLDPEVARGQRSPWYPWPYIEGLTVAEAMNELAFIATGLYGKPIPKQNGAPLRLVTPWKYGFKQVKGIVSFEFTTERPVGLWEEVLGNEYGFWANVNPEVPHPRWSQARETLLGSNEKVPTRIFNGYGEFVAGLYKGLEGERLFM